MKHKKRKIFLRIITGILAFFPGSIIALIAVFMIFSDLKTGQSLKEPLEFLYLIGIVLGFIGMCLCVFNQYNYFTLAMLLIGAISYNILAQRDSSESEIGILLIGTLAILIPNGILCLKKRNDGKGI